MEIPIEQHTLLRAKERGASEEEIKDTVITGISISAKSGRQARMKVFSFTSERNGKIYKQKKIEVYYITENDIIITVTVYVFFGNFEDTSTILI